MSQRQLIWAIQIFIILQKSFQKNKKNILEIFFIYIYRWSVFQKQAPKGLTYFVEVWNILVYPPENRQKKKAL